MNEHTENSDDRKPIYLIPFGAIIHVGSPVIKPMLSIVVQVVDKVIKIKSKLPSAQP